MPPLRLSLVAARTYFSYQKDRCSVIQDLSALNGTIMYALRSKLGLWTLAMLVAFSLSGLAQNVNDTKQWTFTEVRVYFGQSACCHEPCEFANRDSNYIQITPSTELTWYPCEKMFFCAVLDVSSSH